MGRGTCNGTAASEYAKSALLRFFEGGVRAGTVRQILDLHSSSARIWLHLERIAESSGTCPSSLWSICRKPLQQQASYSEQSQDGSLRFPQRRPSRVVDDHCLVLVRMPQRRFQREVNKNTDVCYRLRSCSSGPGVAFPPQAVIWRKPIH